MLGLGFGSSAERHGSFGIERKAVKQLNAEGAGMSLVAFGGFKLTRTLNPKPETPNPKPYDGMH